MKRLTYNNELHLKALTLQRKMIDLYAKLTREFLGMPLQELPFQGIHHLRAAITPDRLAVFHLQHQNEWEAIAKLLNKDSSVDTLQQVIDKVNIHAYSLKGKSFIQLDYSKQVGRWWNVLTENSRGHIFSYPQLALVSLPFQKFFNLNERAFTELSALNLNQESYIMEKLDGTMIHLFEVEDTIFSATRGSAGVYYFNDKAVDFIKNANYETVLHTIQSGYTPIFEILLKPDDKYGQTVKYEEEELRLIAVRHRETGEYVHPTELEAMAKAFGVRSATFYRGKELFHVLQEQCKITNMEGWVVYFEDGLMVKVKGEDYLAEVRSKTLETQVNGKLEKTADMIGATLYGWIQADIRDDQLSFIHSTELRKELEEKVEQIEAALVSYLTELKQLFNQHHSDDRKTFALSLKADPAIDSSTFSLLFEIYKGMPVEADKVKWETVQRYMEEKDEKTASISA